MSKIKIKQIRSQIGRPKNQKGTLKALGLRKINQVVCIDLELETEIKSASSSDDIQDTVDYKSVAKRVKAFIEESNFLLIEALAEETLKIILNEFDVKSVKGRFSKPGAVTGSKEVGVIIERKK